MERFILKPLFPSFLLGNRAWCPQPGGGQRRHRHHSSHHVVQTLGWSWRCGAHLWPQGHSRGQDNHWSLWRWEPILHWQPEATHRVWGDTGLSSRGHGEWPCEGSLCHRWGAGKVPQGPHILLCCLCLVAGVGSSQNQPRFRGTWKQRIISRAFYTLLAHQNI